MGTMLAQLFAHVISIYFELCLIVYYGCCVHIGGTLDIRLNNVVCAHPAAAAGASTPIAPTLAATKACPAVADPHAGATPGAEGACCLCLHPKLSPPAEV